MRALRGMPEFYMSGVALTTGFLHGNIGDTALSVLTGGMVTVLNGPFEICAGDTCTWIWSFEQCFFNADGSRKYVNHLEMLNDVANFDDDVDQPELARFLDTTVTLNLQAGGLDAGTKKRKLFIDEQMRVSSQINNGANGKHSAVPLLIPMPRNPTFADRRSAFGTCMMSARPYDKTDIKICRQGL
eukprot:346559-Rhodomonas_salina.1